MILNILFKPFVIIFFLINRVYGSFSNSNLGLEVPEVSLSDFDEYVKNAKRTPVVLNYPSLFIFSTGAISDFRTVSSLLNDDPKCEFVTVESVITFDGNITSLEPVLSYVKDGETKKYEGPINPSYIMSWLSKEDVCEMRVNDFSNYKALQKALPAGHVQLYVLFGQEGHDPKVLENVKKYMAEEDLPIPVFYVPDYNVGNQVLKSANYDPSNKLPNLLVARNMTLSPNFTYFNKDIKNEKEVKAFMDEELVPPIHSSNSFMLPRFLIMKKTIVYIYTKENKLDGYLSDEWIKSVPKKHTEKLVFLHSKGSELVENKMNTILAIDSEYEDTVVRAFVISLDTLEFYKFKPLSLEDGELNEEGLNKFIEDLENNRLTHYVKSELPIPEHIDIGPVKTIVGEDFHKRVIESREDVLVLFLSSWCGHCHRAKRLFRDIGRRLKGTNGPTIATFDAYNNEVEDIEIAQFPTIALFQSNKKTDPMFYTGEHTLEDIVRFLEKNCKTNKVNAENVLQKHVSKEVIFEFHTEL